MPQEHIIQRLLDLLRFDEIRVRRDDLAQLPPADWRALYDLAIKQRVVALLYHRLKIHSLLDAVPEDMQQSLLNMYRQNAVRNMKIYHEFRQIAGAFQAVSIPLIVLKGAYLAEAVYQNIALRQMGDVDLLVRQEDLATACEMLTGMGYAPEKPFSLAWDSTQKHLPSFSKTNSLVELHWNITSSHQSHTIDPAELWQDSQEVAIASLPVRCLSPEDSLLHLCEHNAYDHLLDFGLRPYADIGTVINVYGLNLDWDEVVARATRRNWRRGVYLSLRLASDLVGAGVPDAVLEKLKPPVLEARIIHQVRQQMFSDQNTAVFSHHKPIALTANLGFFGVLRVFVQRIFIPRIELASEYPVPPNSKRIYFYYLVRIKDLLLRHYKTMWNIHIRKSQTDAAKREGVLVAWLEEKR